MKNAEFAQEELCNEDLYQHESFISKFGFGNFLDADRMGEH